MAGISDTIVSRSVAFKSSPSRPTRCEYLLHDDIIRRAEMLTDSHCGAVRMREIGDAGSNYLIPGASPARAAMTP